MIQKEVNIKNVFYKKGKNSTLAGMAKILGSMRPIMKLFWSLVVLLLLGMCAFSLINAVLKYLSYEIVTTITVRNEIPAKMPTVMICNSNGLMTNMAIFWASYVYSLYNIPKVNNYLNFSYKQIQFPRMINNKANI